MQTLYRFHILKENDNRHYKFVSSDELLKFKGTTRKKEIDVINVLTDYKNSNTSFKRYESLRNIAIFEILFSTGIRIGKLSSLNISDVNFEYNTLLINGKNNKQRIIYLSSDDTLKYLKMWYQIRIKLDSNSSKLFLN